MNTNFVKSHTGSMPQSTFWVNCLQGSCPVIIIDHVIEPGVRRNRGNGYL